MVTVALSCRRILCAVAVTCCLSLVCFSAFPVAKGLHISFIGNEAFAVTDGRTTLLTDFPYTSGAFGYMAYDFRKATANLSADTVCLITHGHADHFDANLFASTKFAIIAPPTVLAGLDTPRKVAFAPEMRYAWILVDALPTPHGTIEHYSYLVRWHGLRLYFSGDTDDVAELSRQHKLDVAFVAPWQLKAMIQGKKQIPARVVVIYHQTGDEEIPPYQNRRVLAQCESFDVPFAVHEK